MANNRIFYACQAVAIAKSGHGSDDAGDEFEAMKGVQSVGITTNFSLDPVFEFGQIQIYENLEDVVEVEVTIEKIIDGEKLLYLQAVGGVGKGETSLAAGSASKCDVYLGIFPDTNNQVGDASAGDVVYCSGMQISSVSYNYSVDANATESITLVGQNKFWNAVTAGYIGTTPSGLFNHGGTSMNALSGSDTPVSGVVRRAEFNVAGSTLPSEVLSQTNPTVGSYGIQSVAVNADLNREAQLELGLFAPYNRTVTFPIEVTCEFQVTATKGDLISVSGINKNLGAGQQITLKDKAGTVLNLGNQNKLSSVQYQGGDTGGGNATVTFSYSTYNDLAVTGGSAGTPYWT